MDNIPMGKCDWCEEEMPLGKMYNAVLERRDTWENSLRANGHKYCLGALQNAYKRFGRVMKYKEATCESFDPGI